MAFQRSYSKVWWGSSFPENQFYPNFGAFQSLDSHLKWSGNLSRIQEADEPSKSWSSQDSPGSLRSQDSGFSDHDEVPQVQLRQPSTSKEGSRNSSLRTVQTPPIRRKPDFSPLNDNQRRSFSAPSSPVSNTKDSDIMSKINRISIVNNTPSAEHLDRVPSPCLCSSKKDKAIKRRKVINQKTRRSLLNTSKESSDQTMSEERFQNYRNETIYIGGDEDDNNNVTNKSFDDILRTPHKDTNNSKFVASTSTPKNLEFLSEDMRKLSFPDLVPPRHNYSVYDEIPHIGIPPPVQSWLDDLRMSYNHEVMSTLQTKSIAQEAFRNLKITTSTVAKIIRQLQTRALILQGEFERLEKILRGTLNLREALISSQDLIESVHNFSKVLERRSVFFTECRIDRKKFEENIEHIQLIVKDLRISLEKQHYLDVVSLLEDILVLKRYVLITIQLVFEKLIRIIVVNIETSKCDLILRANLNMVSTLSNIDYTGFASLNNAFLKNDAVRVFLIICLDSKYSSVRALALRALATICSSVEAIKEFGETGGVEIVRDILSCDPSNKKRAEPEKREAVSLVTQITAPWHGPDHRVPGLRDCVESIVEGLSDIIEKTNCCQTLLLCAASLNNLSRLEATSIYSIMSNESVLKLKEAVESRGPGASIFLHEQIVGMLFNMSGNKKCHAHLANKAIIDFITSIFQSQFHLKYGSRAEGDAHRRTIKTILHIFTRLIHESVVGQEVLQHSFVPIFSKLEKGLGEDSEYVRDISFLARQMNESLSHKSFNRSAESRGSGSGTRFNLTRQESYV